MNYLWTPFKPSAVVITFLFIFIWHKAVGYLKEPTLICRYYNIFPYHLYFWEKSTCQSEKVIKVIRLRLLLQIGTIITIANWFLTNNWNWVARYSFQSWPHIVVIVRCIKYNCFHNIELMHESTDKIVQLDFMQPSNNSNKKIRVSRERVGIYISKTRHKYKILLMLHTKATNNIMLIVVGVH